MVGRLRSRASMWLGGGVLVAGTLLVPFVLDEDDAPSGGTAIAERPNVLLIVTDDQNHKSMSLPVMRATRRIFAEGGTSFPNAIVTTPLCCPSRASIFSGQYSHNHGVIKNEDASPVEPDDMLQHQLSKNGYFTALSGKYFSSWEGDPPDFDLWAMQERPDPNGYIDARFNVNGTVKRRGGHATSVTRTQAIEFLQQFEETDDDRPWFMQVSPLAPHLPATPLPRHANVAVPRWTPPPSLGEDLNDKPPYVRAMQVEVPGVVELRADMLRSLKGVDELVQSVFEWLEANDEAENTLAFFVTDNGFLLGEHGLLGKKVPYHDAVRTPFYARWPSGSVGAGVTDRSIVANIDIAPTVLAATGVDPDHVVDGRSVLSDHEREHILVEYDDKGHGVPTWQQLWNPKWQYIVYGNGTREYYGRNDPHQMENAFTRVAEARITRLDDALRAARACSGTNCP